LYQNSWLYFIQTVLKQLQNRCSTLTPSCSAYPLKVSPQSKVNVLITNVENLGALEPVLGAISCPVLPLIFAAILSNFSNSSVKYQLILMGFSH